MTEDNIPKHIAIIMDGNRRWARGKKLPSLEGHRRGVGAFEKLLETARDLGIKYVTTWAFSTENWKRSEEEKKYLFNLIKEMLEKYRRKFIKEKVKFVHIGRKDRIPEGVKKAIEILEEETKDFTDHTVAMAIDYGGHDELVRCVKKLNSEKLEINEENVEKNLDTSKLPPIDLIIRTGDQYRLSGFMSWQTSYAELYFSKKMFPDFGPDDLKEAVDDFSRRERRFGGDSKK